jgi:hypothetical protein
VGQSDAAPAEAAEAGDDATDGAAAAGDELDDTAPDDATVDAVGAESPAHAASPSATTVASAHGTRRPPMPQELPDSDSAA